MGPSLPADETRDYVMGADLWGGVKGAEVRDGPGDVRQGRAGGKGIEGSEPRGRQAQRSRDVKRGPGDICDMYMSCV
jgi:hypothetical protein